jgi:hypothetical protein
MIEGSGVRSGSVPLTDSDPDPGGPKTYGSGSATLDFYFIGLSKKAFTLSDFPLNLSKQAKQFPAPLVCD